jgi:serine/threonine protein kinase
MKQAGMLNVAANLQEMGAITFAVSPSKANSAGSQNVPLGRNAGRGKMEKWKALVSLWNIKLLDAKSPMSAPDAPTVADAAVRLGLIHPGQVQDVWDELGRKCTAEELLKYLERKSHLTPWQSAKLLKGDNQGFFLGGYRILYKISSGSFGRVYRADDPRSGTIVAIKVLRNKWKEKKDKIDLFEREGKMGMAMRHPNVVQILAVNCDEASKQYFIVMEFVEGGNLRDFLSIRKKLEPIEALRLIGEAAQGLAYAYSRGLTHRDIKPTNILISSQGVAKLVDFGLAEANQGPSKDDNTQVDRTVDYAGLELATGATPGDIRSDIFFLGCVLYECLTGRPPLPPTKDRNERMKKDRFTSVQPLNVDEVRGPPSVFRLVDTMMAVNPHQRYQTPAELCEAIEQVRGDLDGKPKAKASSARSLFIVEKDERLQDALRDKFKELGYRVFIAADPTRALDRYRQQPYDALIIDAGTVGQDGMLLFDRVLGEAKRQGLFCAGILIFSDKQRDWIEKVQSRQCVSILVRPVTVKQLHRELTELLALAPT